MVLGPRVSWLPPKARSLDIALIACQGYFVTALFPSPFSVALLTASQCKQQPVLLCICFHFSPLLPNDAGFSSNLEGRSAAKVVGGNAGESDSGCDPPQ